MIMQAADVPSTSDRVQSLMAVVLAIDWFMDRCRTCINVYGDSVRHPPATSCAAVVAAVAAAARARARALLVLVLVLVLTPGVAPPPAAPERPAELPKQVIVWVSQVVAAMVDGKIYGVDPALMASAPKPGEGPLRDTVELERYTKQSDADGGAAAAAAPALQPEPEPAPFLNTKKADGAP